MCICFGTHFQDGQLNGQLCTEQQHPEHGQLCAEQQHDPELAIDQLWGEDVPTDGGMEQRLQERPLEDPEFSKEELWRWQEEEELVCHSARQLGWDGHLAEEEWLLQDQQLQLRQWISPSLLEQVAVEWMQEDGQAGVLMCCGAFVVVA